jgi:hypothetical protein
MSDDIPAQIARYIADPERCMPSERERLLGTDDHIGFTGTRHGMTLHQGITVQRLLEPYGWVHHGDCVGADDQVHYIAIKMEKRVVVHPPTLLKLRANCVGDINHEPKGYLVRDRDIVNATCRLIAAPQGLTEESRSGTWTTARYARSVGKPVTLVLPDGSCVNWGR